MSRSPPPLDVDYSRYERLRADGANADDVSRAALADGKDFSFGIRMLRSVFELDLARARDVVAAAKYATSLQRRTERLFSYGTLQQENVQRSTFGRLLNGTADALVGFKQDLVEITDPHVLAKSGERFHPIVMHSGDDADQVQGTVFEITAEELAAADAYEVADYERVSARLASGSTAWVYVKRA